MYVNEPIDYEYTHSFLVFIICHDIRGMAGKFVDTSAIRKSNALLKTRFA